MNATERRAALARKLSAIRHQWLGNLGTAPEPGTTYSPLTDFCDPAWMDALRTVATAKIRRDGVGTGGDIPEGYTRATIRAAAEEEAFQAFLSYYLDRDYKRAGITRPERARAVLSALRIVRLSRWQNPLDRSGVRAEKTMFPIWNRAQDARTQDPRRIVHAARGSSEDIAALTGQGCDDRPTGRRQLVAGGKCRPVTDGHMVATDRETGGFTASVILDGAHVTPSAHVEEYAITETVWKMQRGRGQARTYEPCTVDAGRPAATNRHQPQPLPQPWSEPGHYTTRRQSPPTAAHTAADGLATLRRWGRGYERGAPERVRLAAALRRLRG